MTAELNTPVNPCEGCTAKKGIVNCQQAPCDEKRLFDATMDVSEQKQLLEDFAALRRPSPCSTAPCASVTEDRLVDIIVEKLTFHPADWTCTEFRATHKSGVSIWLGAGAGNVADGWNVLGIGFWNRRKIMKAVRGMQRRNIAVLLDGVPK